VTTEEEEEMLKKEEGLSKSSGFTVRMREEQAQQQKHKLNAVHVTFTFVLPKIRPR
jgi:hypothetical protein